MCAPGSLWRRAGSLAIAGVVFAAVSASWTVAVDLTPASQRPFIGSSTNNTERQLIFGYNGFGRVGGQQGGPGTTKVTLSAVAGRSTPIPFGGTRSPVRIFAAGLGGQAGWLVPLGVIALLAVWLLARRRTDPRFAALLVLGGWMAVELAALDFSAGIVHPYYASALGPGLAAMVGAGVAALGLLTRSPNANRALAGYALAVVAITATVGVQLVLIDREGDPLWWRIPLVALSLAALVAIPLARERSAVAVAAVAALMLVAPLVFSFSVWLAPGDGTFPAPATR